LLLAPQLRVWFAGLLTAPFVGLTKLNEPGEGSALICVAVAVGGRLVFVAVGVGGMLVLVGLDVGGGLVLVAVGVEDVLMDVGIVGTIGLVGVAVARVVNENQPVVRLPPSEKVIPVLFLARTCQ
jgi:hypothetical protein